MPSLTQIFNTSGMMGSWELLEKFSIVGKIVQFFLTVYGLLSMVSVLMRVSSTIFYLSNKRKFDEIDRVQEEGMGASVKGAQGFNKLVMIIYCCLPNIKQLSDYGSSQFNLDDDDNTLSYILRTSPSTIAIIVFSTMSFNGILFQLYANVSDGLVAVAVAAKDLPIGKTVTNWINAGEDYNFTLGMTGTKEGAKESSIAKAIYYDLVNRSGITDKGAKSTMGANIESYIGSTAFANTITSGVDKAYPNVAAYVSAQKKKSSASTTTDWDAISISTPSAVGTPPSAAKNSNSITYIGGGGFFIPVNALNSAYAQSPSFSGYMITVSSAVPETSTFSIGGN